MKTFVTANLFLFELLFCLPLEDLVGLQDSRSNLENVCVAMLCTISILMYVVNFLATLCAKFTYLFE